MAKEALASAQLIAGDIENASALQVFPQDGKEEISDKISKAISDMLEGENSLIILVDLNGGTPGNIAAMLSAGKDNIRIISGMNLSMIIAYAFADGSIDEIADLMKSEGIQGIQSLSLSEFDCSDDDDEIEID